MARAPTGWRRSATRNTGRANNDRFAKIAPLAAARQGPYRRGPPHSETHDATRLTCHPAPRRAARLPPRLTRRADSVWGSGSMAVEQGRWRFEWPAAAKRPPGAPAVDSGKYLVRWVNENGRWLMAQDIWNSDLALPMAPPHAAR